MRVHRANSWRRYRGMTLVEAVMAMLIVSVMLVAALNLVSASRMSEMTLADQNTGYALAEDLMAEVLNQAYADPVNGSTDFGPSSTEDDPGDRSLFDDVDDYDGWSASPPESKDGIEMAEFTGWSRSVEVMRVALDDLNSEEVSDSGVKRIVVTVSHGGRVAATLVAYRTSGWQTGWEHDQ